MKIMLNGDFEVRVNDVRRREFEIRSVRELLAYLLLNRNRPLPRERVAETLWGRSSPANPGKTLRQALWRLTKTLAAVAPEAGGMIHVTPDMVGCFPEGLVDLDILRVERVHNLLVFGTPTEADFAHCAEIAEHDLEELLPGWYADWCSQHRERLERLSFAILQNLMDHAEKTGRLRLGIEYGSRILDREPACEQAHVGLMRLYLAVGDRTAAIRQYQKCVAALDTELNARPSDATERLYDEIRSGKSVDQSSSSKVIGLTPRMLYPMKTG